MRTPLSALHDNEVGGEIGSNEVNLGFKRVYACMFGGFAKFVPLKLQANRLESVRILVANLSVFQCIAAALPDMLHISLVIWTNLKVPR